MLPSARRAAPVLLAFTLAGAVAENAHAGGLFFSDRGVRPLGRGGAFAAGADDLGAIYYNPAGLADTGSQALVDMSWLHFTSDYQRVSRVYQVDPNTGQPTGAQWDRTFPSVHGTSPILPIPTIAGSSHLGVKDMTFALGAYAPYAAITSYPEMVNGAPAPQRYSLLNLEGSAMAVLGGWAAWKPSDEFRIGAGVEVLAGNFNASVAFSSCVPDRFICAPEQPDYDAISQMKVGTIVAPSGNVGFIWSPAKDVRIGGAFQLPYWIDAPAKVQVRLPSAAVFDSASQDGEDAHVKFRLPWVARGGVEYRGIRNLRMEADFVYEAWSMHESIDMTPDDIVLRNVSGFPAEYRVGSVSIPRNFRDTWSLRGGVEYSFELGGYPLDFRAGAMYERSAVPPAYLSVLTVDLDKLAGTIGGSIHIGRWRFDGVYAHIFGFSTDVGVGEARVAAVNPVRANAPPAPDYVNGGHYSARADVLGMGLAYQFE